MSLSGVRNRPTPSLDRNCRLFGHTSAPRKSKRRASATPSIDLAGRQASERHGETSRALPLHHLFQCQNEAGRAEGITGVTMKESSHSMSVGDREQQHFEKAGRDDVQFKHAKTGNSPCGATKRRRAAYKTAAPAIFGGLSTPLPSTDMQRACSLAFDNHHHLRRLDTSRGLRAVR